MVIFQKSMKMILIVFFLVMGTILLSVKLTKTVSAASDLWLTSGNNVYTTGFTNVGVGTASPAFPLHLTRGTGYPSGFLNEATGADNDAFVTFKATNNTSGSQAFNLDTGASSPNRLDLRLLNDALTSVSRTLMTWSSNGNIGIGTTLPSFALHLSRGTGSASGFLNEATGTDNDAFVTFKAAYNTSGRRAFNFDTGASAPDRFDLRLLNDELTSSTRTIMSWNYSGNVGIGTTSPTTKLDVNGDVKVGGVIRGDSSGNVIVKLGN